MKLPTLLFSGAILSIFALHFLTEVTRKSNLHEQKEKHPNVQAFMQKLDEVVETNNSPIIEKTLTAGYINRLTINPGFRVVHDPSLGQEVVAKGPKAALAELRLFERRERLVPDFLRPVRLTELVEIRLNLSQHGSQHLRIGMNRPPIERSQLQPDFVTAGPLSVQHLHLANIPHHPIQLDCKDIVLYTRNDTDNLYGKAERLEIQYDIPRVAQQKLSAPNLKAGEVILTKMTYF